MNYQSQVQGSASYRQAKETQSDGWVEVAKNWYDDYSKPAHSNYNNSNNYNSGNYNSGYGNSNYNNSDRQTYGKDRQKTVTYYGKTQLSAQSCSGLSIVAKDVSVDAGETKTEYYTIKNFASEDFSIDSMEAVEYSPDITIAVSRDSTGVYGGETGALKVKFFASDIEGDSTGTAYIKVLGHFGSGLSCEVISDNFYVRVNGTNRSSAKDIVLDSPSRVGIRGSSGFLTFTLENPTNEEVNVRVYSNDVSVSPSKYTFGAKTSGTRTVAINNFNGMDGKVFLAVEIGGNGIMTKYVNLYSSGAVAPVPTGQVSQDDGGIAISTGFFTLTNAGLALGLIVLVLAAIFLYFRGIEEAERQKELLPFETKKAIEPQKQ